MKLNRSRIKLSILVFLLVLIPLSGVTKSPSYKKALKKWTRSDSAFQLKNFQADIIWSASYLNNDLLQAQAEKYGKAYEVSSSEKEEFLGDLVKKRDDSVLFFISFYSSDRHFDDLKNPRAKWDLRLEAGGRSFKPLRLEKIKRPNPLEQLFYPYLTSWSRGYYVWFPVEAARYSLPYTLMVHSPFASSKLVWY